MKLALIVNDILTSLSTIMTDLSTSSTAVPKIWSWGGGGVRLSRASRPFIQMLSLPGCQSQANYGSTTHFGVKLLTIDLNLKRPKSDLGIFILKQTASFI